MNAPPSITGRAAQHAHPAGLERGDLVLGGHAAERVQRRNQHGHGQGHGDRERQRQHEEFATMAFHGSPLPARLASWRATYCSRKQRSQGALSAKKQRSHVFAQNVATVRSFTTG